MLAFFWLLASLARPGPLDEPDLAIGIRQTKDGDFETALLTLDSVVRRLVPDSGRSKDLAQAYLYIGVAYLGLGQTELAKAKFQRALEQDPGLHLSGEEFPLKVLRAFEAARAARSAALGLEKDARKKRGTGGLILLGLGAAAAVGVGVAVAGGSNGPPANLPPTASFTVAPEGRAIPSVTSLTFTATAADPDGDSLGYAWSFGDGTSASGRSPTHVFGVEGTFSVTLTVTDGRGGSVTASGAVSARSVTGTWQMSGGFFNPDVRLRLVQNANRLGGEVLTPVTDFPGVSGTLNHPAGATLSYHVGYGFGQYDCAFSIPQGQFDRELQTLGGTLLCDLADRTHFCSCSGVNKPVTLTRQ